MTEALAVSPLITVTRAAAAETRPLRLLVVHPGATWSTADVEAGLTYGLRKLGVDVIPFRLDQRIHFAGKTLFTMWRTKKKTQPDLAKPNVADVMYQAGVGALEMALRHQVDVVLIVSAMLMHPDIVIMMKRAGLIVTVLFTESPYDSDQELAMAARVDGCWTNERSCVQAFQAVNPRSGYLAHAFHPERHYVAARLRDCDVPTHDVVFVGSGFSERVEWFNSINWRGIDLGLYGTWKGLGLNRYVRKCVHGEQVNNEFAAALYRRARIGLNLYRSRKNWGHGSRQPPLYGESLSPRAYELAACGAFHLSEYRAEVREVFGDLVPTFSTPTEAAALIRLWLADEAGRARVAAALPACIAEASWVERAKTVLGDLQTLVKVQAA